MLATSSLPAPPDPWQTAGSYSAEAYLLSRSSAATKPGWPTSGARLRGARTGCRGGDWLPSARTTWKNSS
eukprot:1673215-Alexandrium_andersonii.AAC.1